LHTFWKEKKTITFLCVELFSEAHFGPLEQISRILEECQLTFGKEPQGEYDLEGLDISTSKTALPQCCQVHFLGSRKVLVK
jgi:hypothetical protein